MPECSILFICEHFVIKYTNHIEEPIQKTGWLRIIPTTSQRHVCVSCSVNKLL